MKSATIVHALLAAAAALLISACSDDEAPPPPTPPRLVKLVSIGVGAPAPLENFPGLVRATRRADLSLPLGGRLASVLVQVGERVAAGQPLAELESRPADLRVAQARAETARAQAAAADALHERRTQAQLAAGDATSRRTLERAEASVRETAAALAGANAALALAEHDRARTVLRAPFAGRVAARAAEPGQEIAAGTTLLQLDGAGPREVTALMPVDRAGRLRIGTPLRVSLADKQGREVILPARVATVGARATTGAAVEIVARMEGGDEVLPGAPAMLSVPAPSTLATGDLVLPYAALSLAPDGQASAFIIEAGRDGVLRARRRAVRLAAPPHPGEPVRTASGLAPGERVVAAGAAFLEDGQPVRVLPPLPR